MKYLNLFETVSDLEEFKPTDEMISYVTEHDKCHVQEMYKICSYTIHLESPADLLILIPSGHFNFDNTGVNKVTINNVSIDTHALFGYGSYGTYVHNFGYSKYEPNIHGTPIYSFPTKCEVITDDYHIFSDYVDVWFDQRKNVVTKISDNTQLMFTLIVNGETIVQPLCVDEMSGSGKFYPYIWCGEQGSEYFFDEFYEKDEEYEGDYYSKSELIPFESGDYSVVLYSANQNIKFDFGRGLTSDKYWNYTLSKNVKELNVYAFARYNDFTEIWYEGTMAEFNAIVKIAGWKTATLQTVHCTDGDLSV